MSSTLLRSSVDHRVALGLGGNLGNPPSAIAEACRQLTAGGLRGLQLSTLHLTAPVDCLPDTPRFHNAAVVGRWRGSPTELLALCQHIERALGRPAAHSSREARIIDLDLLLIDTIELRTPQLTIPHPRLRQRLFVLAPLVELAPDWPVPPDGQTLAQLLRVIQPSDS